MPQPRRTVALALLAVALATSPALAWNNTGHRLIALIAYNQLDPAIRQKVADLLTRHPAAGSLWLNRPANGPDPSINLFMNAAIFPDEARGEPWRIYGRSAAHYVNYRIMALDGNRIDPPLDGENLLNSYVAHLKKIAEARKPESERALSLSWIFHQAGDIHQPLHAVARFAPAWPDGDRGGNQLTVPNPGGGPNLHSYWDGLLGKDESPGAVSALAAAIQAEYPRDRLASDLGRTNVGDWARESADACVQTVYKGLDPRLTRITQMPDSYESEAKALARRRAALAGYRLADELNRLFGTTDATASPAQP
jgi:hypothetical protein